MKPIAWAILIFTLTCAVLFMCMALSYAQGPTALVGPDGRITYYYSYGDGLPMAIIPPAGGRIYHAIPMTPPTVYRYVPPPVYTPPSTYVPPTYAVPPVTIAPSFSTPNYGGY